MKIKRRGARLKAKTRDKPTRANDAARRRKFAQTCRANRDTMTFRGETQLEPRRQPSWKTKQTHTQSREPLTGDTHTLRLLYCTAYLQTQT